MHMGVVGAGIAGRLAAFALIQRGHQVSLFDEQPQTMQSNCSYTAAGMLSPTAEIECGDHSIYQLGQRSLDLWPTILASLPTAVSWQRQGSLLLSHNQDRNEQNHFYQQVQHKLGTDTGARQLNASELAQLEPELDASKFCGFFLPNEGCLASEQVMQGLQAWLIAHGVQWYAQHHVSSVAPFYLTSQAQTYHFDSVIDCRGLGARDHWPQLRAVRGELLWLHAPDVTLHRPLRLLHPRYRLYIVPRQAQQYVIGASEIDSDDMSPLSVRSCLELLSAAYSLHRGFAEARILSTAVHCRPAMPDNLPIVETQAGLIRINGLYRHGFLLAPALIEQAMWQIDQPITTAGDRYVAC
jgi:glycine oxidase